MTSKNKGNIVLFNWVRKVDNRKEHFDRMMRIAESIIKSAEKHNPSPGYKHPILNYIKLLGMKLQTDYLTNLLYADDHGSEKRYPDITPWLVFFDLSVVLHSNGTKFYDLLYGIVVERDLEIDLVKDLILPWPWEVSRYINSIASIGASRPWGEWGQDSKNHNVITFMPIGVSFVVGGNHSITSGILYGEGKLFARRVHDISEMYDYVYTDGINYYRIEDSSVISEVKNVEFAAIFETGRKMVQLGISR